MKDTKTKRWLVMFVVTLVIAGTFAFVASSKSHLYRGLEPLTLPKMAEASVLTAPTTVRPAVDFTKVAEENSERLLNAAPRTELPEARTRQLQKSNLQGPKMPTQTQTRFGPKIKIIK